MAKGSATIDVSALKVAGEGASKYITYIDEENGIRVYDGNNETAGNPSSYAQLNSNGMDIVKDNTTVASFGNTVIIGDTQVSSIVLEDDSIAGYGEDEKTFFNFNKSGSSTTVSSKYAFYAGQQKNLTTKRYFYIPDDILSAMHNNYTVEILIVYQGTTYKSTFGSFTKGTGGVEKTGTIHGVTYTVSTSVINTKDRIAVQASAVDFNARATIKLGYYKTSYSPAYSLGENTSTGLYSVAEGKNVMASGNYSHAEGYSTTASGNYSHAEGYYTEAYSHYSHAEGYRTNAHNNNGVPCHAEGYYTTASGNYSHAEGHSTTASGVVSHAEGTNTISSGLDSHAQNLYTVASKTAQTALGTYNVEDTNTSTHPSGISTYGKYSIIVGNGTADDARSNALTVDWNGNVDIASGAKYKINGTDLTASDVGAVPTTRTVNSKALSSNISLTASDVGAVPTTRTVNSKALSSNISLTASDVGAVSDVQLNDVSVKSGTIASLSTSIIIPTGTFSYQNNTAIASSNLSANSTFYLPSQNTGGTYSHYVNNTSFFEIDHNGFITTKNGMYHVSMSGHLNSQNSGVQAFAIQIYDWTASAQVSYARFAYTEAGWSPIALELTVPLEAGHIIAPRVERYSGSTGKWKISNLQFTLTYLGEGQYVTE